MKRQTFTLVELLTVIAIIGILSAIIIPTVGKARASAQRTTCLNNYKQIGVAVLSYRADNKALMPVAAATHQIPYNPRGSSERYCIDKTTGIPIGVLDYAYINSFKITDGPRSDGYCTISGETKKNGDVWLCPNVLKTLKAGNGGSDKDRAGILLAEHNRSYGKTQYNYNFFSSDAKKPTHIPTNAPVSLDRCPMLAETCANSAMNGSSNDSQKGYRKKKSNGSFEFPAPHDGFYATCWMDGHGEATPAGKNQFLNWQPIDENDKYYAPYGKRAQYQ